MKNEKKYYVLAWVIVVAVTNFVFFLLSDKVLGPDKTNFWIIYFTVMVSFIGQAACSLFYANKEKKEERFLLLPVVLISYIALLMTLFLALQALIFQFLPDWFTIIVAIFVMLYYALAVIRTVSAADMIMAVENKVKDQTNVMRTLTARAKALEDMTTGELKSIVKAVYEDFRYSDPISKENVLRLDEEIMNVYEAIVLAVKSNEIEIARKEVENIHSLIKERNELCKLSK